MEFIDILDLLLSEADLNKTDFAKAVGIPRTTISGWYHQGKLPDFNAVKKLCRYFQIPADELLGITEFGSGKYPDPHAESLDFASVESVDENLLLQKFRSCDIADKSKFFTLIRDIERSHSE